jgi:Leu/Phe-tRNA-protein transferase
VNDRTTRRLFGGASGHQEFVVQTLFGAEATSFKGQPGLFPLDYHHPMQWWEETVNALVVMHDWQQQKQLEATIRELARLALERAHLEGYQLGYEDGKRRAVN